MGFPDPDPKPNPDPDPDPNPNQLALAHKILHSTPPPMPAAYSIELHFLVSKMLEKVRVRVRAGLGLG